MNPGILATDLSRHLTGAYYFFKFLMLGPPVYGAYTQLFAGLSDEVTLEKSGSWSKFPQAFLCTAMTYILTEHEHSRTMGSLQRHT